MQIPKKLYANQLLQHRPLTLYQTPPPPPESKFVVRLKLFVIFVCSSIAFVSFRWSWKHRYLLIEDKFGNKLYDEEGFKIVYDKAGKKVEPQPEIKVNFNDEKGYWG